MTSRTVHLRFGDTNADTFAYRLVEAVREAGHNGVVVLPHAVYATSFAIYLPNIKVTIRGSGRLKSTIKLKPNSKASKVGQPGLINVGADGTVFENLRVNTQNAMKFFSGSCAINTNGYSDVQVRNCVVMNVGIGVGTPDNREGKIPHGLTCDKVVFRNCKHGILFNRVMKVNRAPYVKRMRIMHCSFWGKQDAGISIDCGNDGRDGNPNLGPLRSELGMNTVTNMDDMEISDCEFGVAKKYNVALAKVWNINVLRNTFEGATERFNESINIEHEAHDILIQNNIFLGKRRGFKATHISILTFRDYVDTRLLTFLFDPKNSLPEDGCWDIRIRKNTFKGYVTHYITGEFARKISVIDNITQPSDALVKPYSFWIGCRDITIRP